MSTDAEHALSFGAVADVYERGRPGYPVEAVAWLLPAGARRVVDLGAGTGKATRVIAPLVAETIAVEPDGGMRTQLQQGLGAVPGLTVLDGSGEHIPMPDASVDAVVAAQAWHWVDPAVGSAEVGRVLRPGGTFGLVWNIRDERVPWVAALTAIMQQPHEHVESAVAPDVRAPFGEVERHAVPWVHEQDRAAFVDMVASRSYVSTLPDAERGDVLRRVRDLLDTHPALVGQDTIPVPYTAFCFRAVRP
ncbi:class I SAM-dependent methyltransferase [Curtobacterium sp. RRHDQ10]|uniref:class I SAM-dependent methyltransferase n=1 Tax=Curtobacterium phyllosphaerae TaxID=3413379 RepID=UPI003BEF6D39